jgi:hypothetical protein
VHSRSRLTYSAFKWIRTARQSKSPYKR